MVLIIRNMTTASKIIKVRFIRVSKLEILIMDLISKLVVGLEPKPWFVKNDSKISYRGYHIRLYHTV